MASVRLKIRLLYLRSEAPLLGIHNDSAIGLPGSLSFHPFVFGDARKLGEYRKLTPRTDDDRPESHTGAGTLSRPSHRKF